MPAASPPRGVRLSRPTRAVHEVRAVPLAASALGLMEQRTFATQATPPAQLGWFWSLRRAQRVSRGLHLFFRAAVTGQGQTDPSSPLPAHTGLMWQGNTGVSLQEGLDMGQCVSQL